MIGGLFVAVVPIQAFAAGAAAPATLVPARPQIYAPVTLTADLVTSGCNYPIMELTVKEDPVRPPLFTHIDPPDDTIGPGISFPSVWTFRAEREGTTRFLAQTFGETDCNHAWSWHYEGAASPSIEVYDLPVHVWLPTISSP